MLECPRRPPLIGSGIVVPDAIVEVRGSGRYTQFHPELANVNEKPGKIGSEIK